MSHRARRITTRQYRNTVGDTACGHQAFPKRPFGGGPLGTRKQVDHVQMSYAISSCFQKCKKATTRTAKAPAKAPAKKKAPVKK